MSTFSDLAPGTMVEIDPNVGFSPHRILGPTEWCGEPAYETERDAEDGWKEKGIVLVREITKVVED